MSNCYARWSGSGGSRRRWRSSTRRRRCARPPTSPSGRRRWRSAYVRLCGGPMRSTAAIGATHDYLAKGGGLSGMLAELYGRETAAARGAAARFTSTTPSAGVVASSAILGRDHCDGRRSALAFMMDGRRASRSPSSATASSRKGIFHESLNFAAMRQAPVLFVCENNGFSTHTRLDVRQPSHGADPRARRLLRHALAPCRRQRRVRGPRSGPRRRSPTAAAARARSSSSARPTAGGSTSGRSGTTTRDTGPRPRSTRGSLAARSAGPPSGSRTAPAPRD